MSNYNNREGGSLLSHKVGEQHEKSKEKVFPLVKGQKRSRNECRSQLCITFKLMMIDTDV